MDRSSVFKQIDKAFKESAVVTLTGPKQVGKTTVAKDYLAKFKGEARYYDLGNPFEKPALHAIEKGLIILDGVDSRTSLLQEVQNLAGPKRKFLLIGATKAFEKQCPFAATLELAAFSLSEIDDPKQHWLKGGYPKALAAYSDEESFLVRQNLLAGLPMRRLIQMLAHCHGQQVNATDLARSLEVSDHTIRRHLELLVDHFVLRRLNPWVENINKRQVKTPKMFFRDSGLLHALLGIKTLRELETFPKLAAFWESYALEQVIQKHAALPEETFFWETQGGASLDLLLAQKDKRLGFVFHYGDRPKITPSLQIALNDLKLDHLYLVVPGKLSATLSEKITLIGLSRSS